MSNVPNLKDIPDNYKHLMAECVRFGYAAAITKLKQDMKEISKEQAMNIIDKILSYEPKKGE